MHRPAVAALAMALLLLPSVLAATDPGRRSPDLGAPSTVNDVAISDAGTRVAAAVNDAGSSQVGQNPDQDVWILWDEDGAVLQHGTGDRASCSTPPDNCQAPATHVAMSDDGKRVAVLSRIARLTGSSDETLLVLITDNAGDVARITLPGEPRALAITASGSGIAVLTEEQPSTLSMDTRSVVRQYDWGSGGATTLVFTRNLDNPGSEIAFSRDGSRLLVATNPSSGAGQVHWFARSSSVTNASVTGARPQALAVAPSAPYRALAGYHTGDLALFADNARTSPNHKLQYGGGATGVTDVAIARSGLHAVAGYSDGTLRAFAIDASLERLARLGTDPDLGSGAVNHLAISGDSKLVAAASGTTLAMFALGPGGLTELWRTSLAAAATSLALDLDGSQLAVGTGSAVAVFEARRTVVGALVGGSPAQVAPGARLDADVRFENTGNRHEVLDLALAFPSGWFASVDPTTVELAPGQSATVDLAVVVPEGAAPGTHNVYLNHSRGATRIDLSIPLVRDLVLDLPEGPGLDIDAGETLARQLVVANRGNRVETARPTVQASDGWSASVSPAQLSISPGEEGEFQVSVTAPAGAAQGASSTVTITLPGFSSDAVRLTATVGASFGVAVDGPSGFQVAPGENKTLEFTVRNTGNTLDSYDLALEGGTPNGWTVELADGGRSGEVSEIAPGSSRTVAVTIVAEEDAGDGMSFSTTLRATSQSEESKTAARSVLVSVDEGSESTTTTKGKKGSPGPAPVVLGLAVLAAALVLRRRD